MCEITTGMCVTASVVNKTKCQDQEHRVWDQDHRTWICDQQGWPISINAI